MFTHRFASSPSLWVACITISKICVAALSVMMANWVFPFLVVFPLFITKLGTCGAVPRGTTSLVKRIW